MDTKTKNRRAYVLDWAWKRRLLIGLPKTVREAFNAGFDAGFDCGLRTGREQGALSRQMRIPGMM
jgi:hypothetical protein